MTPIHNATIRKTRSPFVRWGADNKPIIVSVHPLGPEDAITLRLERRRSGFTILVPDLYRLLVRQAAFAKQMQKVRDRKKSAIAKRKLTA